MIIIYLLIFQDTMFAKQSEAVTCNPVAMEVQHLCKLLTEHDKGLGSLV